jgi:EpsD family peptidyl-prolyl cis-trans isomerase
MSGPRIAIWFAALVLATVLSACSRGSSPGSSQVVAKVNGSEITVYQLNGLVGRAVPREGPQATQDQARGRALDSLVDQELLVQQALEKQLDRDPGVLARLDALKRQTLAQAYLASVEAAKIRPSDDEVRKYFDANPALFSHRRVYALQEVIAQPATTAQRSDIEGWVAKAKSLQDVTSHLKEAHVPFIASTEVRGAEQLPIDAAARLATMKAGDVGFIQADARLTVAQIVNAEEHPVQFDEARAPIERFLTNQKRGDFDRDEVARLHRSAKIEYAGGYEKYAAGARVAPPTAGAAPAPMSTASTSGGAVASSKAVNPQPTALGISGLH